MVENRSLFYISGFISLSLFVFFLALFIFMMFSQARVNQFALTKDNYISISLDMPKIEKKSSKKKKFTPAKEKTKPTPISPNVNVGNLFNKVWTKNIKKKKVKKKVVDSKRIREIQKKINTIKSDKVNDISKKVNTISESVTSNVDTHKSSANEINEYLAKIQALVYTHFNPPQNSQGNSVKAVINLSSIGKVLDFRILNYSANSALNDECDLIKDRLMSVVFPINPKNNSGNYIIILTSKE